jgi:hypothetical protein
MENTDINQILIEATINVCEMNTTGIKICSKLMAETERSEDRYDACFLHCSKFILTEPCEGGRGNVEAWDSEWEVTYYIPVLCGWPNSNCGG